MRYGIAARLALVALLGVGQGHAQSVPYVPLTDVLPPLYQDAPAEDRTARCGVDGLHCVRFVEAQLAEWEAFFGCDHRAVFPTVYRLLTREARLQLEKDPGFFDDPAGFGFEALAFYELYEQMITDHLAGRPIPPAWETAMAAAQEGDWTALHDMLLAINAHVQRDMPFALAVVGLTLPDGASRKPDHDRFNQTLNAAYTPIVNEIQRRYDPFLQDLMGEGLLLDNLAAQQLVALWREGVWRNAERLVRHADSGLAPLTADSIEWQAELTAEVLATGAIPGRRALRRAHCERVLAEDRAAGEGSAVSNDTATTAGGGAPSRWWALAAVLGLWQRRRRVCV
ncbi:DUF5995 family protein [Algiphilus sp.]|uniref:DUF5995 family protein n=1 Tax=Algiphilus sp. TaxID=1872431 RepID=UPI003B52BB2A